MDATLPAADARDNRLLAGLSPDAYELLVSQLATVSLPRSTTIALSAAEIDYVYFPLRGMISLVITMKDGKSIETTTIGRDGVFGAMTGFDHDRARVNAIVQIPVIAARIAAAPFRKAVERSPELQKLCIDYNEKMLVQSRITAACNALHKVEARFCRWLLQASDVTGSNSLDLTQEFMAEMLGVRRTSVTDVATRIQATGAISYSRGLINIVDAKLLREHSCECYGTLRESGGV